MISGSTHLRFRFFNIDYPKIVISTFWTSSIFLSRKRTKSWKRMSQYRSC